MTSDGSVKERLFEARDEGLEINKVVQAAEGLLGALGEEEKKKIAYPVNAREWRSWSRTRYRC